MANSLEVFENHVPFYGLCVHLLG